MCVNYTCSKTNLALQRRGVGGKKGLERVGQAGVWVVGEAAKTPRAPRKCRLNV